MHKFKIEAKKFIIVGIANFALTLAIFTTMLKVFSINYLLSLVIAWIFGILFSYALNFSWVFKPDQKLQFKDRFLKFFFASLVSIVLNILTLSYIVESTGFDPFYVQIVLIPVIVIFNFTTAKFWSLQQSREEPPNFNLKKFMADGKWLDLLSWVVIFLFLVILMLGVFVPIYADEVATKMTQATVLVGEWEMHTLVPQCRANFALKIPISWYPAATIYRLLYSGISPLGIRIFSLATTFSWLALIVFWAKWTFPIRQNRIRILAVMAAVVGLGVLPFTVILSRSEQWLLLLLAALCVFPIAANRASRLDSRWFSAAWFIIFCIGISLFFYAHPKAVFFLPFVITSAYYGFISRSKLLFGFSVLFAIICAYQSMQFANALFSCEDAPILASYFASQTTNLGMLTENPLLVIHELLGNLISAVIKVTKHLVFQKDYQSSWLPSAGAEISTLITFVNMSIRIVLSVIFLMALAVPPIALISSKDRELASPRKFFIASLWLALVGHLAIYKVWNFYGGALVMPLMVLLLALSYAEFTLSPKRKWGNWILAGLFTLFLTSSAVLIFTVVPRLVDASYNSRDGLSGQPLSVPTFNFPLIRERVRSLAKTCNIQGDGAKHLVVDDLTYFAFKKLNEPLHLVYLYEDGFGADIKGDAIHDLLSRTGSGGVIAQCTFFPSALKENSMQDGNYCCLKLEGQQ